MTKKYNIAIVGATGVVGSTLLSILAERNFPINNLHVLASKRSSGDTILFADKPYIVEDLNEFDFKQADIAFFCVSQDIAAEFAPKAASSGCIVIDKSTSFRYDPDVPLIVPEVNL